MTTRRLARFAPVLYMLTATCLAQAALAQAPPSVPLEMQKFTLRSDGTVHFCINTASALANFDRAVAETLAGSMMVESALIDIVDVDEPMAFDFRFIVAEAELFLFVTNQCDVLMGYQLPPIGPIPEWLTVTRPYYAPRLVLASHGELPPDAVVGSMLGTTADTLLRRYLQAGGKWTRRLYPSYAALMDALSARAVDGILLWEPALYLGSGGDPAAQGITVDTGPLLPTRLQFSAALPANASYLRTVLDDAIAAAQADGTIDRLAGEHALPSERDSARR